MDIFIMYFLMIGDLLFTFFNFKEAEELNPLFEKLLYGNGEVWFIYVKLGMNTAAAYAIIIIRQYRKTLSVALAMLGILVYGAVFYLHIEIYIINHGSDPITPGIKEIVMTTGETAGDALKGVGERVVVGE